MEDLTCIRGEVRASGSPAVGSTVGEGLVLEQRGGLGQDRLPGPQVVVVLHLMQEKKPLAGWSYCRR